MKAIKIDFIFLESCKKLILVIPTRIAITNINGSIIRRELNINKQRNGKKKLLQAHNKYRQL